MLQGQIVNFPRAPGNRFDSESGNYPFGQRAGLLRLAVDQKNPFQRTRGSCQRRPDCAEKSSSDAEARLRSAVVVRESRLMQMPGSSFRRWLAAVNAGLLSKYPVHLRGEQPGAE